MEIPIQRRSRRSRAISVATTCLSTVVTLVGLALLVPSLFGMHRVVITGTSMTGTIDYGSLVFEEVVPVSDLRVGDIITYQPPPGAPVDGMVTHRIVAIHGDVFRTQGDAVPQRDPWKFRLDQHEQGRVRFAVPYVGYPFMWLGDRQTRILAISVPAGIVTLVSLGQAALALRRRPGREGSDSQRPRAAMPAGG